MTKTDTIDPMYRELAGELVANLIVFGRLVEARRPETRLIPGVFNMVVDAEAGVILLAKIQPDGRVVLIERLRADPADAVSFGQSDLPLALVDSDPEVSH